MGGQRDRASTIQQAAHYWVECRGLVANRPSFRRPDSILWAGHKALCAVDRTSVVGINGCEILTAAYRDPQGTNRIGGNDEEDGTALMSAGLIPVRLPERLRYD